MANYIGGILSDQIKFYYCSEIAYVTEAPGSSATGIAFDTVAKKLYNGSQEVTDLEGSGLTSIFNRVKQLQSVPSLGGTINKIDVTCLEDTAKRTINGLIDYGDDLSFTFLYDPENYAALEALGKDNTKGFLIAFKAPDSQYTYGDIFLLNAKPSVSLAEVAVDSALTFNLSLAPQSEIKRKPAVAAA